MSQPLADDRWQRAQALIGLADPRFRDELTAEAKRLRYL